MVSFTHLENRDSRTDGTLCAAIHERLHRVAIDFDRDTTLISASDRVPHTQRDSLEHGHPPEHLGRVLQCVLHVLEDGLLLDGLLDPALRLDAEGITFE